MTTIIQTTPWGVCQRYYDDAGRLLYSAYVARRPTPRRSTPFRPLTLSNLQKTEENPSPGVELARA